jgi:hypothetical protein
MYQITDIPDGFETWCAVVVDVKLTAGWQYFHRFRPHPPPTSLRSLQQTPMILADPNPKLSPRIRKWCRKDCITYPLCGSSSFWWNCTLPFPPTLSPCGSLLTSTFRSSGLKHACPHGVFMSLTPGDPTLWSGVIFVRKGSRLRRPSSGERLNKIG